MWKFSLINISVCKKKKNISKVIENYEKSKTAPDIVINDTKKLFHVNTVEEELVLQDDVCL